MGFRYRKSIRLGGGFRINISGSGIGYSWGVPGYRITKTADGKIRQTASIPGTGISYVSEESIHSATSPCSPAEPPAFETEIIQSTDRSSYKDVDFAALMRQVHLVHFLNKVFFTISVIGLLAFIVLHTPQRFLLTILSFVAFLFIHYKAKVNLEYVFSDEQRTAYEDWYHAWRKLFACDAAWYVTEIEKGHSTKTNAGASEATVPKKLLGMPKLPYYLSTNVPYFSAALSKKESFYILPDKIFYLHNGKLSAYDADEVDYRADIIHPIIDSAEMEIPADAKVVGTTWLKVNADGSRDKRYKNNRQCSVCECGRLRISSPVGLNLCLMLSNSEHIDNFNFIIANHNPA